MSEITFKLKELQYTNNPFFDFNYEPALESLGNDFFDQVQPAKFSQLILRFRNNKLLPFLGLDSATVTDQHFLDFGGCFQGPQSCLALRYHGHQFGQYNPYLRGWTGVFVWSSTGN